MIERNIGNVERILRLSFGLCFMAWVLMQGQLNIVEWFVAAAASMLMLNGIFSRCYLWYVLEINTCEAGEKDCSESTSCV